MRICGTQAHDWNHDASHSGDGQATEPIASQEDDAAGLQLRQLGRDDACKILADALSSKRFASGTEAKVYRIPGYPDLLLRVPRGFPEASEGMRDRGQVVLTPVNWPVGMRQNCRLGIALASVEKSRAPDSGQDGVMRWPSSGFSTLLLRKVDGSRPADHYWDAMKRLDGVMNNTFTGSTLDELIKFNSRRCDEEAGLKAARYFLEKLKSGESFQIGHEEAAEHGFQLPGFKVEMNEYGPVPHRPDQNRGKDFYKKYVEFSRSYLERLEGIARMPQKAFDEAIFLIAEMNDCYHVDLDFFGRNVLIDQEAGSFGFVDIFPQGGCPAVGQGTERVKPAVASSNALAVRFGAHLFGIDCHSRLFGEPPRLIYLEQDLVHMRRSTELLLSKLDKATPGLGSKVRDQVFHYWKKP